MALAVVTAVHGGTTRTIFAQTAMSNGQYRTPPMMRLPNDSRASRARAGDAAVSPDGRHVVFTVTPADPRSVEEGMWPSRSIWIADLTSGQVRSVPLVRRGASGASGVTTHVANAAWSPDGRFVAFTAGPDTGSDHLFVLDVSTWRTKQVGIAPVDVGVQFQRARDAGPVPPGSGHRLPSLAWVSDTALLVGFLPPALAKRVSRRATDAMTSRWRAAAHGDTAVSVLDSPLIPPRDSTVLAVVVPATNRVTRVLSYPYYRNVEYGAPFFYGPVVAVARDNRHVAMFGICGTANIARMERLGRNDLRRRLLRVGRVPLVPDHVPVAFDVPLVATSGDSVIATALDSWSPDGTHLALFGRLLPDDTLRIGHLWTVAIDTGNGAPAPLRRMTGAAYAFGYPSGSPAVRWVAHDSAAIASTDPPGPRSPAIEVSRVPVTAVLDTVDATNRQLLVARVGRRRVVLWHGPPVAPGVFVARRHNRQVGIRYVGRLTNDTLNAVAILPANYVVGRRYPTVLMVYGGYTLGDTVNFSGGYFGRWADSLADRGYVVLEPSIPLHPEGTPSDPLLDIPKSILPAIDTLIARRIADSGRLAVMGQSFGGYTVYALLTQTHRFKAAIALAGLSDLASIYGEFSPSERYGDAPHDVLFSPMISEGGSSRMGSPPWADPERYVRNSPVFHADQITTPLLIVQGDMDYVPIQQGEEMFSALYRQGKRARFIRYWDDGHTIDRPAHVAHLWHQLVQWLATFLAAPSG